MIHDYDKKYFKQLLKRTSLPHGIAFAADCCERMLPAYVFFSAHANWGDHSKLRELLDVVWDNCISLKCGQQSLKEMLDLCFALAPDLDDFMDYFSGAALDACSAVHCTICLLLDHDPHHLVDVVDEALEPVYAWADAREGDFDREGKSVSRPRSVDVHAARYWENVRNQPMIRRESQRQRECLDLLLGIDDLDEEDLAPIRQRSRGLSSIAEALEFCEAAIRLGNRPKSCG